MLQVDALVSSVSGSLREGPGFGLSPPSGTPCQAHISETVSRKSPNALLLNLKIEDKVFDNAPQFPLSFSHYVLLIRRTRSKEARLFYEKEALRGGWTVRQLERQIDSQFYERLLLSKNKAALLKKESTAKPEFAVTPEEEIKDPFVFERLGITDEYSKSKLEETLKANLTALVLTSNLTFSNGIKWVLRT